MSYLREPLGWPVGAPTGLQSPCCSTKYHCWLEAGKLNIVALVLGHFDLEKLSEMLSTLLVVSIVRLVSPQST